MSRNQVDVEDVLNYGVYFFFSFASFSWLSNDLFLIGDLNFALHTFSTPMQEVTITFPRVMLVLSVFYLIYTNDWQLDTSSWLQVFCAASLIWMIISPPFVPFMYWIVQDVAISSVLAFFIQSLGWAAIGYKW